MIKSRPSASRASPGYQRPTDNSMLPCCTHVSCGVKRLTHGIAFVKYCGSSGFCPPTMSTLPSSSSVEFMQPCSEPEPGGDVFCPVRGANRMGDVVLWQY